MGYFLFHRHFFKVGNISGLSVRLIKNKICLVYTYSWKIRGVLRKIHQPFESPKVSTEYLTYFKIACFKTHTSRTPLAFWKSLAKQLNIPKFMVVTLQIKYVFFKSMEATVSNEANTTLYQCLHIFISQPSVNIHKADLISNIR